MGMSFDNHNKLMLAVAAACVISTGLGIMYIMAMLGFLQNWILIIAPAAAVSVAGVFLYAGRQRRKAATEEMSDQFDSQVISDGSTIKTPPAPIVAAYTPETQVIAADTSQQSQTIAVDKLMNKLETKIEQHGIRVAADTSAQIVVAETTSDESLMLVDKSKQLLAKKREQRCIVITAPSHGVLQDRLNNWLSGGSGLVISTSMAMNDKGFYLTVFYEPSEINP